MKMLSTPTLKMAKRHFEMQLSCIDEFLYGADRLAYQIAIDCIDSCLAQNIREQAMRQADAEVDKALRNLFEGRTEHAENAAG
jgi:hypothetical protein